MVQRFALTLSAAVLSNWKPGLLVSGLMSM